jgi:NAD-dependent dihydropyrimidine dehydrogenase PreA subunit
MAAHHLPEQEDPDGELDNDRARSRRGIAAAAPQLDQTDRPHGRKGNLMTDPADLDRFIGGSIAAGQAGLAEPLREVHRAVLRRFLATGAPPTARWVEQAAAESGLDASAAGELAAADAVHISDGVVSVAYPFSGIPTPHRVALDGLPAVSAMCAIDALGIPAMAGRDGRITSADPADATPILMTVRHGTWSWTPAATVVVAGRSTDCGTQSGSFEAMCPNTAFHASPESARAYLASHGNLTAQVLDQDTAIECGRLNFATLLNDPA